MASVALVAFALGLDGGCLSVLLWLLSVACVALDCLALIGFDGGAVSSLLLLFQARSALL